MAGLGAGGVVNLYFGRIVRFTACGNGAIKKCPRGVSRPLGRAPREKAPPMGQDQHIGSRPTSTSGRRLHRRTCLRKGCGCRFQPRRWNQRYCQDPQCLRLVRRWQAAKRQRVRRQREEHRQQHREAERQRRSRSRKQPRFETPTVATTSAPTEAVEQRGAWSRGKSTSEKFCDRPGCYDPVRYSCRARARYCGQECCQAMRRVQDRERKWLRRNTYEGRFKRQLEYQQARRQRVDPPHSTGPS